MIAVVGGLILVIGGAKGYGTYKMIRGFAAQGAPKFTTVSSTHEGASSRTGCRR